MSNLNIEKSVKGGITELRFSGVINEDAQFSSVGELQTNRIIFDFDQVTAINSCGIREWIEFVDNIEHGVEVTYRNCPQVIIEQINMVSGFITRGASVDSFYAPYFCGECDNEIQLLLLSADLEEGKPPIKKCETCDNELEFDALEKQYLRFLKRY